ncbi:MAG: hypothetical protein KBS94_06865 [Prevotella sp.]|nr:hypothetical protein [Candidatus Equicola faecalis]MDO4820193.1 hypothetical protein [Prevotella sp.]
MANKRDLKKLINYSSSELFAECIAVSLYSSSPEQENVDSLLRSIIDMRNDYVERICHVEPGKNPKEYFDALIQDFNQQIGEVLEQINSLN